MLEEEGSVCGLGGKERQGGALALQHDYVMDVSWLGPHGHYAFAA
jgi:hypothetical protein